MNTLFNTSLWGDEAFSAVLSQKPFWPMIQIVARDTSPPLFYVFSFFWTRIFGPSEMSIRSLSFLFYLGTAFVVYLIGKELFNRKSGLLASLLTFFNPFLFPYAFEGRMYFCLLFFVVLSFYFLIKKNSLGYVLAASSALYSHHFAVFALVVQFVWQALFNFKLDKKAGWQLIKPYLLTGLLYLPWLYPLYLQTSLVSTGFWLGRPKFIDLLGTFVHFLIHKVVYKIQTKIPALIGLLLLLRKWIKKELKTDLLLVFWAVLPLLLTFLVSQTKLSIFYERYLLYCVPPIMLLISSKARKISYPLIIAILGIYFLVSWNYFSHPFKRPFREFTSWIKENAPDDLFIVNYNGKAHHLWEAKYYGIEAPIYSPGGKLPFYVGTAQMTDRDVVYQLPEEKQIGLISSDPPDSIEIPGYRIKDYHQIGPLYFIYLEKK